MLLLLALADCCIIIILFVVCVLIWPYMVNTVHELTRAWFHCATTTATKKVELFNLESKSSCNLPDLHLDRWSHTSVGGVICGGKNCVEQSTRTDISSGSGSSATYQPISPS